MALIKWEPLRDIEDMFERYSRSLGAPFFRPSDFARPSEFMANGEWSPRVDISENDGAFLIKAEIPGVSKENVNVTLENGVLTLPNNVDSQHLKAHFHDGLLEVAIPKTPETQSSSITVPVD